jgi:glycosyltransferase involved in cell wall biosynthesis
MKFLYIGIDPMDFRPEFFKLHVIDKFDGVRQLGNEVDYICRDESKIFTLIGGKEVFIPLIQAGYYSTEYFRYILAFLNDNEYDFVYLNSRLIYPEMSLMAQTVKAQKFGTRVIYEPTCWPIDFYLHKEMNAYRDNKQYGMFLKKFYELLSQRRRGSDLSLCADVAVVFGFPSRTVWEMPAIPVPNGISVNKIHAAFSSEALDQPVTILAVADGSGTCGFERLFRGLKIYYEKDFHDSVTIDIVSNKSNTASLRQMAAEIGIEDHVNFLGEKSLAEINDLCATHSIGVGSLDLYLEDRIYASPWITKFFCAAGIPFLYTGEDIGLDSKVPFALKLPNLDAPINMELVSEFVWRCRFITDLAQQERRYAEQHFDWRILMKRILLFTATGKLEA